LAVTPNALILARFEADSELARRLNQQARSKKPVPTPAPKRSNDGTVATPLTREDADLPS
jgi:hypothetical protein